MRTLQEKYNAIQEGNFSKDQFLVEARMQQPNIVTRFNGYDDAVQILKNKGMISDVKIEEARLTEAKGHSFTFNYNTDPDDVEYIQRVLDNAGADAIAKAGTFDDEMIVRAFDAIGLRKARKAIEADGFEINENVNEARLTKNSLTDYRYKPTNDMDKYPYEQILRGLRVELEVMGVQGTPTAEEYAKALAKVSKNLAKDSIFYTNQLAGVNPKVDLHDKMVDATAKNTVDTFNGMKKIKDLKEDHTKKPDDKYTVKPCKDKKEPWAVWEGEKRVKGFATKEKAKEYADSQNKKQDLTESVLKEGIKNLIKKALMENEEDIYEMQGPKEDSYYKNELSNYLEGNQIYGYTDYIHDLMTGPDPDEAYKDLAEFLEDEGIYGYNRGIERIYADYPYDQHWMNQEDEDESLEEIGMFHDPIGYRKSEPEPQTYTKKFVKATDKKGIYVYDIFKNGKLVKTIEGGEGDANAWINNATREEDLFESVSLKDLLN